MPDTENSIQEKGIPVLKMKVEASNNVQTPVDKSLTIPEEAADAKATGDAIKSVKTELEQSISELAMDTLTKDMVEKEFVTEGNVPDSKALGERLTELDKGIEAVSELEEKVDTLTDELKSKIEVLDREAVKLVNGIEPYEDGDVKLSEIENARELITDDNQETRDEFIIRLAGGGESIQTGNAKLRTIEGSQSHNGYVPETLDMIVEAMPRTDDSTITAMLDKEKFRKNVSASGAVDLYYTSAWNLNPANYGITISGQPVSGDHIRIEYVKEERGTITTSNPTRLIATGLNQYNQETGYARLCKYSSTYGYRIGGTYEEVLFSNDPEKAGEALTISDDGGFQIPEDGYVIVTGGDDTTYIYPAFVENIQDGSTDETEPYKESEIDLTDVMASFPYGLCKIGTAADVINLDSNTAISRIDRMEFTAENLAIAAGSGRDYVADEDYIYLVREAPVEYKITIDGRYTVDSRGLEIVDGTEIPCHMVILYGESMIDKLKFRTVTYDMTVAELIGLGM